MSEKSRVRWLCRRGMKELDVMLEQFMQQKYDQLTSVEHDELLALLKNEDPVLYGLLLGNIEPGSSAQAELVNSIQACARIKTL